MRTVDLFSGCGGMSLGFQNAGFEVVAAFDNWQPAIDTYSKNFDHDVHKVNLGVDEKKAIDSIKDYNPLVIIGGPRCQDFSIAGQRNCSGERANLTISFANIVSTVRPDIFVMENVYNIEKSKVLPRALKIFKEAGYGLTSGVLDASYLGVPQARKRYFLIGKLNEEDDFLKNELWENHSFERMTVREYLGDSLDVDYYYMHPRSYNRRAIFSVDEASSTIRGVNRPIPESYKMHPADKANPEFANIRALTYKERSFLQTFPEDFEFVGSKTNIEQQIGNAVPVNMARHVANSIQRYLNR